MLELTQLESSPTLDPSDTLGQKWLKSTFLERAPTIINVQYKPIVNHPLQCVDFRIQFRSTLISSLIWYYWSFVDDQIQLAKIGVNISQIPKTHAYDLVMLDIHLRCIMLLRLHQLFSLTRILHFVGQKQKSISMGCNAFRVKHKLHLFEE